MRKALLGLVCAGVLLCAGLSAQDGRNWRKEAGYKSYYYPTPSTCEGNQVAPKIIIKDVDNYKIKYVIIENCYNWLWENYTVKVAIYEYTGVLKEDNRLIQYCDTDYTCSLGLLGINCPDNTQEWEKELDYLGYTCMVLGNPNIEDIIPMKERASNTSYSAPHFKR